VLVAHLVLDKQGIPARFDEMGGLVPRYPAMAVVGTVKLLVMVAGQLLLAHCGVPWA